MSAAIGDVTLVLSCQRSGSTVLCQDIAGIGGLGRPNEYLLPLINERSAKLPDQDKVVQKISMGCQNDAPEVGALKLMVNQAQFMDRCIRQGQRQEIDEALDSVVEWLQSRFQRVQIISLIRRNALDQAISRVVARETKIYHLENGEQSSYTFRPDDVARQFYLNILKEIPIVLEETETINRFSSRYKHLCLPLIYEEAARKPEQVVAAIFEHAERLGFDPRFDKSTRSLNKVITAETALAIKKSFKSFWEDAVDVRI